jgi:ABC-type glycerol-3-phosphate transport system permease component
MVARAAAWFKEALKSIPIGLRFVFFLVLILFSLTPYAWLVSTAFKPASEVVAFPPRLVPRAPTLDNIIKVFNTAPIERFFLNSTIVSVTATLTALIFGSMAGYAFAKLRFPARNVIFLLVVATMMVPWQITIIPLFNLIATFHWVNSYQALIVPKMVAGFAVFLMRQFIMGVPNELMESARMDGCSFIRIYWSIILPNIKPALAALAIFKFLSMWNDYLWPIIVVKTPLMRTLPLGVALFFTEESRSPSFYNLIMSASLLALLPTIVLFLALQKHFIRGVVLSGLKG